MVEDNPIDRINIYDQELRNTRLLPEIWNMYERFLNSINKTCNRAKVVNRRLYIKIIASILIIWTLYII